MARVYGKIESLKSLKSELVSNGIHRFNSIKEIKDFLSNFKKEKLKILNDESEKLDSEYKDTCINLKKRMRQRVAIIAEETEKIDNQISDFQLRINSINTRNKGFLRKLFTFIKLSSLKKQSEHFIKNKSSWVDMSVKTITRNIQKDEDFIQRYKADKQNIIAERAKPKLKKLEKTKLVIEQSRNLISGAIGDNLVVKEVKKLSDDYVLINDFNLRFSEPIYYRKQNHRIYSIQIDHLLISKAGIFIIETKNWSEKSVNSISLRSPIEQIQRSNFALYIYISENIPFYHHWGEQTIPIRNLIVMIKNKPMGQFKYVTVKLLKELNDYITYYKPVLTDKQFNRLVAELK